MKALASVPGGQAAVPLALLLLSAGCSGDPASAPGDGLDPGDGPVSEFSIVDVNATSPRYDEMVSPRDYTGQVSAWYFGHAT